MAENSRFGQLFTMEMQEMMGNAILVMTTKPQNFTT